MSDDFRVKPLSNAETRTIAKKLRKHFGVASDRCIDVLECAQRSTIWTVNGERTLNLEIRSDAEMPNAHGITSEVNGVVTIRLRQSVRYGAYMGDGRHRNTYAHEFGHAALGHAAHVRGAELARRPLENVTPKWIAHHESAEHQAKVFAPAFLINDTIADTLASAEDIAVEFGISLTSAEIYFEQLTERRDRETSSVRVSQIANEVRQILSPKKSQELRFIDEPCTACGQKKLIPMGVKFLCVECDSVSDRFQDGDTAG
jgi:hypothetical protein